MFRKKPTVFDKQQDRQLQALITNQTQMIKNQKVLIENNAYFIEQIDKLWAWIPNLDSRLKSLEARMTANEAKDAEQAKWFADLSQSASQTEVETSE